VNLMNEVVTRIRRVIAALLERAEDRADRARASAAFKDYRSHGGVPAETWFDHREAEGR
jgi:hypothetical protein